MTSRSHLQKATSAGEGAHYFDNAHDFTIHRQVNNAITNDNRTTIVNNYYDGKIDIFKLLEPVFDASHERNREKSPPDSQCLPGTRAKLIKQIKSWANSGIFLKSVPSHVLWLYGYVGCGKSAIAQTVAETFSQQGRLAASFFFYRGAADRSTISRFPTTLASQLLRNVPATLPLIEIAQSSRGEALRHSPAHLQFRYLFLDPFHRALQSPGQVVWSLLSGPYLTVIDGLDECEDHKEVGDLIKQILSFFKEHPRSPLRFFISSRVEEHIRIRLKPEEAQWMDLAAQTSDEDIAFVVDESFKIAAEDRVIRAFGDWPSAEDRRTLVKNANGSFIAITTMLKFILGSTDKDKRTARDRLPLALNLNNGLDELYAEILSRSQDLPHFHSIISTITLLRAALSTADMAHLLRIELWEVLGVLVNLYAIVHVPGDDHSPVTLFHSSLREYLTMESRSGRFFVPPSFQKTLAYHCFENLYRYEKSAEVHMYALTHYSHHWEEYLALYQDDQQSLQTELREVISHILTEHPSQASFIHSMLATYSLLDFHWLTHISGKRQTGTKGEFLASFCGIHDEARDWVFVEGIVNVLDTLLNSMPGEGKAYEELEPIWREEGHPLYEAPPLPPQHTILTVRCVQWLFAHRPGTNLPVVFLPVHRNASTYEFHQQIDVAGYSFWAFGHHLAMAIKEDPDFSAGTLVGDRKHHNGAGTKAELLPFEYLKQQRRLRNNFDAGRYLKLFRKNFQTAISMIDRLLRPKSVASFVSSDLWTFTQVPRTAGQSDFWVFGCLQDDLSILNLWVGYSMIARCYIASMDGSHDDDTCTLHVKWNEANGRRRETI